MTGNLRCNRPGSPSARTGGSGPAGVGEVVIDNGPGPRRPRSTLALAALLLLGGLTVVPAAPAAAATGPDPTAVHRLTVGLYGHAYDDADYPTEFVTPPALPGSINPGAGPAPYTNVTVVDLPALAMTSPPGDAGAGELSHGPGLRLPWWRGPFLDPDGVGALPEHDGPLAGPPVRMCFENQRATWTVHDGNAFRVTTRIGLFRGPANFGCDPDDLKSQAELSVAAPPTGQRVCGQQVRLLDDGDFVDALLCLTNQRIDPRPAAAPRGGNSGTAPFTVVLDGSSSVTPNGVTHWHWTVAPGMTVTGGPVITHTYPAPGSYPVTLRITDTMGLVRSAGVVTVTVHAAATAPVARITGPAALRVGQQGTFDATASTPRFTGPGVLRTQVIGEYWWDFGDGQQAITRADAPAISHSYAQPGAYTVTVTVHTLDLRAATAATTTTVTTPFGGATAAPTGAKGHG